jgi:hypothetical protein
MPRLRFRCKPREPELLIADARSAGLAPGLKSSGANRQDAAITRKAIPIKD